MDGAAEIGRMTEEDRKELPPRKQTGRTDIKEVRIDIGTATNCGRQKKETETARSGSRRRGKLPTENHNQNKIDGSIGHVVTGRPEPNQGKIGTGTATEYGHQEKENMRRETAKTARSGSRLRVKLPKVDCEETESKNKDVQVETALGCSNMAISEEMEVDHNLNTWMDRCSMMGDKVRKRKRSGKLKYKIKEMVTEGNKEEAVKKVAHLHHIDVGDGRGLECGENNTGPKGIFNKKNWKSLQQNSALNKTSKKTSLKTKQKIRSDYTKVGKNGKNGKSVQDIVKFFGKNCANTSQSLSLTRGNINLCETKTAVKAGTNLTHKFDGGGVEETGVEDKCGKHRGGEVEFRVEASIGNRTNNLELGD